MEELLKAIERVRSKVNAHRSYYSRNEEAVKQQIVFEILEALGWNVKNPDEVRPEDKTGMGRADYALVINGDVIAYIEAKKLSVDIIRDTSPLKQLGKYCYDQGVEYGVITNGVQWRAMKSFEARKSIEERVLLEVDLLKDNPERSAFLLSFLSKGRIQRLEELATTFNRLESSFLKLKREGFNEKEIFRALMERRDSPEKEHAGIFNLEGAVPISQLENVKYTRPIRALVKSKNGWIELKLIRKAWRVVLERYAEHIYERKGKLPYVPGYIVKNVSELRLGRRDGKDRYYSKIGEYYVYIWLSAEDTLKLLKKLQEASGVELALEVEMKKK